MGISELQRNELIAHYYSQVDTSDAQALLDRGRWNQSQGKHELAIEDLTAAIELEPETTDVIRWR